MCCLWPTRSSGKSVIGQAIAQSVVAHLGADIQEFYDRTASFVDRILRGAKPGDLPVEQPTKYELVVNIKTAKSLGITILRSILTRADRLIE